jgi:putative oxidoreductase
MIRGWYRKFASAACACAPGFLLFVRLYWGWQFAQTGWGKLHHLSRVAGFFDSLHIPVPYVNAVFVSWLEFIGGILLALGLGSRFVAFLLAIDMSVAYLTAGRENLLSFFSNPGKFYGDDAFTFLFASLIILFFGPGWLALDQVFRERRQTV